MTRLMGWTCLVVGLAGCASNKGGSNQGGTSDINASGSATGAGSNTYYPYNYQASPPPTFRPGSNPNDIRDPNTFARPAPGSQ